MLIFLRTFRITILVLLTLALIPIQAFILILRLPYVQALPLLYHRLVARILKLDLIVTGEVSKNKPILFIANHSSWVDIVVLSSLAPVSFVAKSEISLWPGVSLLAKLQSTVFVIRSRQQAAESRSAISKRLSDGDNIVLFAEGTSADGNHVLPFKSSLFAAAEIESEGEYPAIQSISIAYTHLNHLPLGRRARHQVAWYGKMPLGRHIWSILGQGHVGVSVAVHPPVSFSDFSSRKELSNYCYKIVSSSHGKALYGRNEGLSAS